MLLNLEMQYFQKLTILITIGITIGIFLINQYLNNNNDPKNVFFDLGANIGDSIDNLFGTNNLKAQGGDMKSKISSYKLDQKWTIYAIEGNSFFDDNLRELKNKLSKKHKLILLNGTVATTYDGKITFYLDKKNKGVNFWGSSILKEHPDVVNSNSTFETKPCVDMARLLKQYSEDDFIVVKMDIEGAEFDLLLHLAKENVLKLIDVLFVEYHWGLSPYKTPADVYNKLISLNKVQQENWT